MMEGWCAGPELAGDAVWQRIGIFAPLNEVFSVVHDCGLVKSRSVRFADQVGGCCVAATLATVDLS
jgi:hypothetical protein